MIKKEIKRMVWLYVAFAIIDTYYCVSNFMEESYRLGTFWLVITLCMYRIAYVTYKTTKDIKEDE
jgi:hypothetical protein